MSFCLRFVTKRDFDCEVWTGWTAHKSNKTETCLSCSTFRNHAIRCSRVVLRLLSGERRVDDVRRSGARCRHAWRRRLPRSAGAPVTWHHTSQVTAAR